MRWSKAPTGYVMEAGHLVRQRCDLQAIGKRELSLPRINKTELLFARELDFRVKSGELAGWKYEAVGFRLARRTFYYPDFLLFYAATPMGHGRIELVEVKGRIRDDALVKFKVAAELFPWFDWTMIRRRGNDFVTLWSNR